MRVFFFICLILLLPSSAYGDLREALNLAKRDKVYVFLYVEMSGCIECKRQKVVFDDDEVKKELFRKVQYHVLDDTEIEEKYKIESFPTYFLLDHDGNVIRKNTGYKGKKPFLEWLRRPIMRRPKR